MRERNKSFAFVISVVFLSSVTYFETAYGEENSYKFEKQDVRFQNSSHSKFQAGLGKTLNDLGQKSDNLEAMNQNLEGRINMLAMEKDKLSKAYAQMKTKLSALEKDHTLLKKKAAFLETAYKKLSAKTNVAAAPKKPQVTAKKPSVAQKTPNKVSAKPQITKQKTAAKNTTNLRNSGEQASSVKVASPVVSAERISEERQQGAVDGVDVKKANEKGIEYGKKGMYDEAIKEFQRVATMNPEMPNIHYNLGLAYKKKGMMAEAEKEFAEYERLK